MLEFVPFGGVAYYLLVVVHVTTAAAVTLHALLKKRDVRAATGWIGVAWLSPILGPLLYWFLGINRVTRRALRLSRRGPWRKVAAKGAIPEVGELPENIATVARVGERLTGYPLTPGNEVAVLHGGDEAYPAMIAAIQGAKRSIALASYIFRLDDTGESFVQALAEAKARGVEIRVLVDGIGAGYFFAPIVRRLAAEGVAVARFLHDWMPLRMAFVNMRSHKKILVVDGALGFTGGLNIGDENLLEIGPQESVSDIHFRVAGPVVQQLMLTFAEDWNFTTGEVLESEVWWPDLAPVGNVLARGFSSGPDEEIGRLEAVLQSALGLARQRIRIVTPYFLPDQRLMSSIALAALRGVEVEIVIPEATDHRLITWATRAHLRHFLAPGVRFFFSPPPFDHAKLMTVDANWCFVGSPNWDVRSTRLNFEFSLECYDGAFTAEVDRVIDRKVEKARTVPLAAFAVAPLIRQLRDAAARLFLPYL